VIAQSIFQPLFELRELREVRARAQWSACVEKERRRNAEREGARKRLNTQHEQRAGYAQKIGQTHGAAVAVDRLAQRALLRRLDDQVEQCAEVLKGADSALAQAAQATSAARDLLNSTSAAKEKTGRCIDTANAAATRELVGIEEIELEDDTEALGARVHRGI
jgi:hypothetical protein